jgi:hypothetical protein
MNKYVVTRVSPGKKLDMPVETEYDLTGNQMLIKGKQLVYEHYKNEGLSILKEFGHTFVNVVPRYAIIVIAIDAGYGLGIVKYDAFIVKQIK